LVHLEDRLKDVAALVDARLDALLPPATEIPTELHQAMRHSCLAPGKRIRPALALAACQSVGGSLEDALDAGCAIEMVHCFSLIHDDLPAIDNDDLRRGRPTCHKVFGEAVAILAGDALFALAYGTLAKIKGRPERIVSCLEKLSSAAGSLGLVGGETIDILSEGLPIDADTLEQIHVRKTGALMQAACTIGGILGGGTPEEVETLSKYGYLIGHAFQVADDILNEVSTAEELGKAVGSDRERGKATYPALYGLEKSRSVALQWVDDAIVCVRSLPNAASLPELARYSVERLS
jgi:geranylgeranyl diphosphate synthase, type II